MHDQKGNMCLHLLQGLGVDACHCMECNTCMALSEYDSHKCRPLSTCPVCTDPLFHSSQPFRVRPPTLQPCMTVLQPVVCLSSLMTTCKACALD